ncbi:MAG: hypothetical protein EOM03_08765 [Clostridia bacterium]|nr:hypothetical protein [Clostridia bacterium]NLF20494.1 hypothetical protein [Clostridiaceae bacterium]
MHRVPASNRDTCRQYLHPSQSHPASVSESRSAARSEQAGHRSGGL